MRIKKTISAGGLCEWLRDTVRMFETMNLEGQFEIEIKQRKGNRTLSQNAYIHKVFEWISEEIGESPQMVKELMREKFLRTESDWGSYNRSTTELDTREMSEFTSNVIDFAEGFLNVVIPRPEEMYS